jgi:3-hydroxyisobutyrate dehydrogenase-like beta-hydroxyacid dehydrogenase
MAAPVALVGLGNMGQAVAERLLDAGRPLHVHNRTPGRDESLVARGATRLDSAADALASADVCLQLLADDAAVEAVAGEVLAGAQPGTLLVDMSTISVAASARVADAAAERGVDYLRAPVSGNPTAVRAAKASIFVSGDEAAATRCEDVLREIAPTVRYVGEGERARVLKLALQILVGGTAGLLSEAVVLGEAAGLDRRTLLEVVGASAVGSPFVHYKTAPLLEDDYAATFTTAMMRKDVDLVLDLAGDTAVDLPLTGELRAVLGSAIEHGHGDEDFISLVLELQERATSAPTRMRSR